MPAGPAFHRTPHCGEPPMSLDLRRAEADTGAAELFRGRRVAYSFNTRVAIRAATTLLGLTPGDEVLAPAYNCGSELDPLRAAGLAITLYPVDAAACADPVLVERLIGPRTRAIYLTHYFGMLQPARMAFRALADAHKLWLVEDCALSLLSGTLPVEGKAGHVSLFCFYKFFPVLAGGAMVVNDDTLTLPDFSRPTPRKYVAKRVLRAGLGHLLGPHRSAGMMQHLKGSRTGRVTAPSSDMFPDMPSDYYFDPELAGRGISRMTARALTRVDPVSAAAIRRTNYTRLLEALAGRPDLAPLYPELHADAVPLSLPLRVSNRMARNALVAALQAEGIAATPWWAGYNRHFDFSDRPGVDLSAARALKDQVLSLPVFQSLGPVAIEHIAARTRTLSRA